MQIETILFIFFLTLISLENILPSDAFCFKKKSEKNN